MQYEVMGRFNEAGHYVGKEDFDISRSGTTLRVRGKSSGEAGAIESLVAGVDEAVELPLDADWDAISAEYLHCTLRVTVPRLSPEEVTSKVLPPELLRKLESLTMEEAQMLMPEGITPEALLQRLEELPDPAPAPAASCASAPEDEGMEGIQTPSVAADHNVEPELKK